MNSEKNKETDLVPIEELAEINSDIKDVLDDGDYSSDITDLEHQLALVKQKEKESLSPTKYDKTNDLETKTPFSTDEVFADYIEIRDSVRATNNSIKALLKSIPLEGGMLKPMILQTIAGLYRALNSNMKLWMEMHKDIRSNIVDENIKNKQGTHVKEQHNTFNFEGTTGDIIEKVKNGFNHTTGIDTEVIEDET